MAFDFFFRRRKVGQAGVRPVSVGRAGGRRPNINDATVEELSEVKSIGEELAQAIVDWRARHGRFTSPEDLKQIHLIDDIRVKYIRRKFDF